MKTPNLLNSAQKSLLFVELKKQEKAPLFQNNCFYSKIAVTLYMTANILHKTKCNCSNRPLIKHRL